MPLDDEFETGQLHSPVSESQLLPKDFFDILVNRYLPVVSLTYIGSLLAYAIKFGGMTGFLADLFTNKDVYWLSLYGAIWVTIPAIIWILMKGNSLLSSHADLWYKVTAGMMAATLILTLLMFPIEGGLMAHAQSFIVAVLPIHVLMYFYFVKGGMPVMYGAPLSVIGAGFMIYGFFVM